VVTRTASLTALVLLVVLLFQSHWVDDVGTSDADVAGIAVSAAGTVALIIGLLGSRRLAGRALLALGLGFVMWVSAADLMGVQPDGSRAASIAEHWATTLGWSLTIIVAVTLMLAVAAAIVLYGGSQLQKRG
jgi:hypothetical protein